MVAKHRGDAGHEGAEVCSDRVLIKVEVGSKPLEGNTSETGACIVDLARVRWVPAWLLIKEDAQLDEPVGASGLVSREFLDMGDASVFRGLDGGREDRGGEMVFHIWGQEFRFLLRSGGFFF
jgi:hypothetical protein